MKIILYSVIVLFSLTINAQTNTKAKALDQYFSKLAAVGQFNGSILVAENGAIVYEKSVGYADFSSKKPNTQNTAFLIASVTKTITATAILQLQEKGKLEITDIYSKYFPDFPYPSTTIKQLLSHTSFIPSSAFYRHLDSLRKIKDTVFVNADVIPAFVAMKKPLLGEPKPIGDRANFAYSNVNYYLLALLIEKLSGMSYSEYMRKHVFAPAGMTHSSFAEFYFGTDPNICTEHRYRFFYDEIPERVDTTSENAYIFKTYNLKGHGDVVSTTHDLLNYDAALRKGVLIKPSTLEQAFQPIVYGKPDMSGYGLGWSIMHDSTNGKVVFHHGGSIGMEVMLVRNITRNQTVIYFDNTKNFAFNKAMDALKILNGANLPLPKQSVAKVYGKTMATQGIPAAKSLFNKIKKDSLNYSLSEDEINVLGYQFLQNNKNDFAYEVFRVNVELFPSSWNAYDSYGEILLKMGKKEEAIKMYEKSLALNPGNDNGKKMLEQIRK